MLEDSTSFVWYTCMSLNFHWFFHSLHYLPWSPIENMSSTCSGRTKPSHCFTPFHTTSDLIVQCRVKSQSSQQSSHLLITLMSLNEYSHYYINSVVLYLVVPWTILQHLLVYLFSSSCGCSFLSFLLINCCSDNIQYCRLEMEKSCAELILPCL